MPARSGFDRLAARVLLPALLVGILSGCGPDSAAPDGDDGPTVASPSEEPSASQPTETEPSTAEPSDQPATGGLSDALLPADELPGFNDQFTWAEQDTQPREPRDLGGTCHKFELTSIGAEEVTYRTYRPVAGDNSAASELVAQFPDEETATRAMEVLKSWRDQCKEKLAGYDVARVGDLEDVATDAGEGRWYLLIYGPPEDDPDSAYFDAQGMAMVGDRIAVVRMVLIGQDYNYEAGQEPMVAALRAAAARLG